MTYQELPLSTKIKIKMICNRNNITKPSDIETAYNNYVEGRDIFEGLSEDYQRVSAFDNYLANGGHIYSGEDEDTQQMQKAEPNIFQRPDGSYFYQVPGGEEIDVTPINTLSEDNSKWTYTDASGRIYNPTQPLQSNYSLTEAENVNEVERAINNYTRELAWREANDPASIALQGKYVLPAIGMSSLAASPATLPYLNTALTSGFGAHGIQDLANGNADWQTALEVAPLASLAKPMARAAAPALEWAANGLEKNVGLGRNAAGDWNGWIRIGNREFRPSRTTANIGLNIDSRPIAPDGWEYVKPITLGNRQTWQVKHPKWGFSTLEEANGSVGFGPYTKEVTNEALDSYIPGFSSNPINRDFIDELRWVARRIESKKETPGIINNTDDYPLYPKLWNVVLKTERGKEAYPNGATMVGRGIWPGSSQIAESPNYPALFVGYNRDMGMPYARIGTKLEGRNNFGQAQYEKYFPEEKVKKLREIDTELSEYLDNEGHYLPEHSNEVYKLHHQRNLILGDKAPEFGGYQQLLIPNDKYGEPLRVTRTVGLKSGDKWENMHVKVPSLTGEETYTDPDLIAKALAENGERLGINGVHVTNIDPLFEGFHDKGVGTEIIWGQHGFAPYLKSVYGNSFQNLLGTIESAYKKGGKLKHTYFRNKLSV